MGQVATLGAPPKLKGHDILRFCDNLVDVIRASHGAGTSPEYDERFLDFGSFTPSSILVLGIREASVNIQKSVKDFTVILLQTPFADSLPPLGDCAEVTKVDHLGPNERPYRTPSYWSPCMERYGENSGKSDDIWALGISLLGMMGELAPASSLSCPDRYQLTKAVARQFAELIEAPLGELAKTPLVIVIDALDECEGRRCQAFTIDKTRDRLQTRLRKDHLEGYSSVNLPQYDPTDGQDLQHACDAEMKEIEDKVERDSSAVVHLLCDNTTASKYYSYNWKGQLMDEIAPSVGKETHGTIDSQQPVLDAEWIVTWIKIHCPDAWEAAQKTSTNIIQVPATFFDTIDRVIDGRLSFRDQMVEHGQPEARFQLSKKLDWVAYRCSAPNQETLPVLAKDFDDTAYSPEIGPAPTPYTMTYVQTRRDTPGGQSVFTEASQSITLQLRFEALEVHEAGRRPQRELKAHTSGKNEANQR
ncbi:kinase [Fusarium napiforme]|uniref:Kinase n=1 Tax=Fusarium napiforme TaxID=42672 RepID=A0A8H5IEY5_9HYPO|nr:kinase [Fusarium napiforme]